MPAAPASQPPASTPATAAAAVMASFRQLDEILLASSDAGTDPDEDVDEAEAEEEDDDFVNRATAGSAMLTGPRYIISSFIFCKQQCKGKGQ